MTVIEFFDRSVIKNVANALFCNPERVITVGHDIRPIRESFEYLRPLIEKREKEIELIAMNADRSNVREIIEVLERIVEQYDDCVFDLTGGEDLYLVAVGAIMATHKVQCHYFDFKEKKLIDCDDDGEVFGREIVKKVLITSDMEHACTDPDTLRERMDEMGIKRIEQAHEKREAALSRLLRGLSGIGA